MICNDIEKEIKKDNEVFLGCNKRQIICILIGVGLAFLLTIITKATVDMLIPVYLIIGLGAAYCGKKHKNNRTAEQIILKKISKMVYSNEKRVYRTMNRYVLVLNKAYASQKRKDLSNKKILKLVKTKQKNSKKKRTKMKSFA